MLVTDMHHHSVA